MKLVVVLAVLCCFTLSVLASPVREESAIHFDSTAAVKVAGRQAPAAPAAASDDEDEDDDDDDDALGLDLDDDDDDDDDEDDDDADDEDDDGDLLERVVEDIFGGDDDDDDDDEDDTPVPVTNTLQAINPIQSNPIVPPSQPVIPPNVANDLSAAVEAAAADNSEVPEYGGEEVAEEQAAGTVVEASEEGAQSVPLAGEAQSDLSSAPVAEAAVSQSNADNDDDDDDDDDDDEDETGLELPGVDEDDDDDDDDADDATDDDDDDDVEDEISELTEARRARAMSSTTSNHVPAIYIAKYNRFVDNILGRINKILRTSYNPVTVKLTSANTKTKSNKNRKTKGKGKGKGNGNKRTKNNAAKKSDAKSIENSATLSDINESNNGNASLVNNNVNLASQVKEVKNPTDAETTTINDLGLNTPPPNFETSRATAAGSQVNKKTNKRKSSTKKNKTKAGTKNKPKARATLYGLSSLQRVGDVSVNMMSDHTTVKTKFSLGPLTLKVEKEFGGRSGKKELRSATATTAEMSGKLNLRVLHGGAATLHSIRVLQPKQVRVESADDHDRTREFVWKRSSHIAHVVSQKLSSATKSMLRPPPVAVRAA